jgi:hypothetical protein
MEHDDEMEKEVNPPQRFTLQSQQQQQHIKGKFIVLPRLWDDHLPNLWANSRRSLDSSLSNAGSCLDGSAFKLVPH